MTLYLEIDSQDAEPYNLDFCDLEDAIKAEARTIADDADAELLDEGTDGERDDLAYDVERAATAALWRAGDSYRDPTGVTWRLVEKEG